MSLIKILFICLIFLFFGYLINKLLLLRQIKENQVIFSDAKFQGSIAPLELIEGNNSSGDVHREGMLSMFGASSMNSEYSNVAKSSVIPNISNTVHTDLLLKQYCIKASYNSALTGRYVNLDMIKYVLSRGCRFLDFEVYSFDGIPYVAYSVDNTFSSIKTLNKIPLQDVLNTSVMYGFMAPSPNPNDPLFIHLRVKTNNNDLYEKIAMIVNSTLKPKLYDGHVTSRTYLSDLMNKIVLIVDKKLSPKYQSFPECGATCFGPKDKLIMNTNCPSCFSLKNYVNVESGTTFLRIYNYSYIMDQTFTSPEIMDDGVSTNVSSMKIVIPDIGTNFMGFVRNPSYHGLPLNYGVQIVVYPFYQRDIYLDQYEQAFADGKSAFVPLSTMLHFVNKITSALQA
jgi:hypothetical protein